jgi:hypothetical protein
VGERYLLWQWSRKAIWGGGEIRVVCLLSEMMKRSNYEETFKFALTFNGMAGILETV